jgi:hypothetical protein
MKAAIRSLICAAVVLSTLCLCGPVARASDGAEDATEWANHLAQQQQERQDWLNSIMAHADYVSSLGQH